MRGFSLIELAVVMFVVVLGLSVIGSNIASGNKSSQMKAAVRDLMSALRYARGQALISQKEVAVAVNLADNSYQISNREKVYSLPAELELTMVIAQEEFSDEEVGQLRFYPDGSSSGGRITMEWGALSNTLDINWLSGKVEQHSD